MKRSSTKTRKKQLFDLIKKEFKDLLFDKKNNAFRILYTIKSNILVYYQLRVVNDFVFFSCINMYFQFNFYFQTKFFSCIKM